MNTLAKYRVGRYSVRRTAGALLLAWGAGASLPALAVNYYWNGKTSSEWGTASNWGSGTMAPTGGTFDVTVVVTNRTQNRLVYSEANGSTLFTNSARCLRIADSTYGSMAITGGTLETRGTGDFVGNSANNSGYFLIDGGTYVSTNANAEFYLGANTGFGTLTISNGIARIGSLRTWCSSGTVNLVNGTLGLGGMSWQTGVATFNLYGGTLQALKNNGAWMLSTTNWACKLLGDVTLDSQAYAVTTASSFNGPGSLTKIGSGSLTINVSNTVGAVTVNAGTLALGGANTVGAVTVNAGTLALGGSNTVGAVTVNAGTLGVNHAAALGSAALTINGGNLDNSSGAAVVNVLDTPVNINASFGFLGTADLNLGAGAVTLFGSTIVSNGAKTLTFAGPVSDNGGTNFLKTTGTGTLALKGSLSIGGRVAVGGGSVLLLAGANSYTGATSISAGTLVVANNQALGTTNAATSVADNGAVQLTNSVTVETETIFIAGNGAENRGALQAANASTGTWNGVVMLNDANTWTPRVGHKATGVLIINGPIQSGFTAAANLYVSGDPTGSGRVIIAGTNNTYKGITGIVRGTLALGANNALPVGTVLDLHPASVTDGSKFDLAGYNQTVGAWSDSNVVSGPRVVTNSSKTASVLTINQASASTYAGRIDGAVSLVKEGVGTLTLAGTNNAYTGTTTVKGGTLELTADGALSAATALTLEGGTLAAGSTRQSAQSLAVAGASTIDLGDGTGRLVFGSSEAQAWSGVLNLTGTFNEGAVRFGTGPSSLTAAQLALLRIDGRRRWWVLDASGYLHVRVGSLFSVL